MSDSSSPNPATGQPKQLSSRLLTMKFMQRAAASAPVDTSSSRTPSSEQASKRRRIDVDAQPSTPTSRLRATDPLRSMTEQDFQSRARREGDETEWVLYVKPTQTSGSVSQASGRAYEDKSGDEDDIWANQAVGRQIYGSFKRRKAHTTSTTTTTDTTMEDDFSPASNCDESSGSRESGKAPGHGRSRDIGRTRPNQAPSRSTQAPKRFFDQISMNTLPAKGNIGKKGNTKQNNRNKPRTTI